MGFFASILQCEFRSPPSLPPLGGLGGLLSLFLPLPPLGGLGGLLPLLPPGGFFLRKGGFGFSGIFDSFGGLSDGFLLPSGGSFPGSSSGWFPPTLDVLTAGDLATFSFLAVLELTSSVVCVSAAIPAVLRGVLSFSTANCRCCAMQFTLSWSLQCLQVSFSAFSSCSLVLAGLAFSAMSCSGSNVFLLTLWCMAWSSGPITVNITVPCSGVSLISSSGIGSRSDSSDLSSSFEGDVSSLVTVSTKGGIFLLSSALSSFFSCLLFPFMGDMDSTNFASLLFFFVSVMVSVAVIFELLLVSLVPLTFLDVSLKSCDQLGLVEPVF